MHLQKIIRAMVISIVGLGAGLALPTQPVGVVRNPLRIAVASPTNETSLPLSTSSAGNLAQWSGASSKTIGVVFACAALINGTCLLIVLITLVTATRKTRSPSIGPVLTW